MPSTMIATVLLVEDDAFCRKAFQRMCEAYGIKTIVASTLAEGRALFQQHGPILDAIILDGAVDAPSLDSLPLIAEIVASGFRNPIIAASSNEDDQKTMCTHGCTHLVGEKSQAAQRTSEILRDRGKL